jgi:hypothetical protein
MPTPFTDQQKVLIKTEICGAVVYGCKIICGNFDDYKGF